MLKSLVMLLLILPVIIHGQGTVNNHEEDHHADDHKHEVGMANSAVYFFSEKTLNYGLHLHYTFHIPETRFRIGAGYERIFDEHRHNAAGINFIYEPVENLHLNLSPAVAFEGSGQDGLSFAIHFEVSYEFRINHIHIGPTTALGSDFEEVHMGLGLHIGYGF